MATTKQAKNGSASKPKSAKRAPTPAAEPAPPAPVRMRLMNGIQVPVGTVRFKVLRYQSPTGKGEKIACSILAKGERCESFLLQAFTPSWDSVKAIWGSGTYRFQWFKVDQPAGISVHVTFDDPACPQLPDYCKSVPLGAEPPPEPPGKTESPFAAMMRAQTGSDGKVDIGSALVFLGTMEQWQQQRQRESEAQYRRWQEEDKRRADEREMDHRRAMEKEREAAAAERERTAEFYQGQMRFAKSMKTPESDGGDRIEDLAESVADLAESVAKGTQATSSSLDKALEALIPVVAQRMMGAPAALPPKASS